ncbi:MAG: NnrS family protein [Rhodospirillales bacterium]|jgi:uncharacterized protein involved in response to NO
MPPPEFFQLEKSVAPLPPYPVVLAKGFRIFFLAAGLAGLVLMPLWLAMFEGRLSAPLRYSGPAWHGHEMVYGYAFAVIAGFLLTAVYNWVGRSHLAGWKLASLAALWLLGRLAMLAADLLPGWLAAAADIAFLPALALVLAPPLIAAKKPENLGFLPLLLLAASYNAAFHLDILGLADLGGSTFLLTATVEILLVFVVILSSRILVMFTENGVPGVKTRQYKWIERLAAPSAAAFVIADLLPFTWAVPVASLLALAAALIHAIRLSGWRTGKTLKTPLVWVLHLGYAGLVAALALKGLSNLELVPSSSALHAMTVATLGPITLGMMARVGLGHTGRLIRPPKGMALAFALLLLAGILRTLAPMVESLYFYLVILSGLSWIIAFAIFLTCYLPILTRPRTDGQAG